MQDLCGSPMYAYIHEITPTKYSLKKRFQVI